jgi:hypothetical protein
MLSQTQLLFLPKFKRRLISALKAHLTKYLFPYLSFNPDQRARRLPHH